MLLGVHIVGFVHLLAVTVVEVRFFEVDHLFVRAGGHREGLPRQYLDGSRNPAVHGAGNYRCLPMAVVVIFQVFEDVTYVQEGVSIQADVHEGGLHARQDSRDFSFVDAADERKLFFPLDVNLD
jgi:hypothetical protein